MNPLDPDFDSDEWRATLRSFEAGQSAEIERNYLSVQSVLGPYDACKVQELRKKLDTHVHFGKAVPAEVFILAVGDPPSRDHTKIGGLPFWPKLLDWPTSESGVPLTFIAQFNFAKSAITSNIISDDIMLIFADAPTYSEIRLETVPFVDDDALLVENVPLALTLPAFYGCRWLTHNFPEWRPLHGEGSEINLDDGSTVLDPFLIFQLLGMQIGLAPFTPPDSILGPADDRILCSVCSVTPEMGIRYPFLNHPSPLTDAECGTYTVHLTEASDSTGGIGIIYAILCKDGSLRSHYHIFGR
jgi:hypothetical protein